MGKTTSQQYENYDLNLGQGHQYDGCLRRHHQDSPLELYRNYNDQSGWGAIKL
jgi:hypothetical protein